jgi:integrase
VAAEYVLAQTKRNTRRSFTRALRNWHPIIGELYLSEITVDEVEDFIEKRRATGVTDGTVLAECTYLSGLFTWLGCDTAENNPVKAARVWKRLQGAREITRFLTHDEEARILKALGDPQHRDMVAFAIETGLRKSEQLNLRCRWVDLKRREVHLFETDTKDAEARVVPLSARALAIAERYMLKDGDAHLFRSGRTGRYVATHWFWYPALELSGVSCRWHDLRHTFATRWLRDGGEIAVLQRILGHANLQTTMRYAHVVTETMHHQMRRIDEARAQEAQNSAAHSETQYEYSKLVGSPGKGHKP